MSQSLDDLDRWLSAVAWNEIRASARKAGVDFEPQRLPLRLVQITALARAVEAGRYREDQGS